MTTDDNQKLRQLLDMTAALISSMDVARRGHTETDRTAWVSYKVFATRYMAIIHQLPQDFPARKCSDLRGSEQAAAFQEGVETSSPPGAKEGCQGHLAVGALP